MYLLWFQEENSMMFNTMTIEKQVVATLRQVTINRDLMALYTALSDNLSGQIRRFEQAYSRNNSKCNQRRQGK